MFSLRAGIARGPGAVVIWNKCVPRLGGCRPRRLLVGGEQGGPQSCQRRLVKISPGC
jgi:hypothetical protein